MDGGYWVRCTRHDAPVFVNLERVILIERYGDGGALIRIGAGEKNHYFLVDNRPDEIFGLPRVLLDQVEGV